MKMIIVVLFTGSVRAQNNDEYVLDIFDAYAVVCYFDDLVHIDKFECYDLDRSKGLYELWKIRIDSVLFMRDSTVYENEHELKKVEYIIIRSEQVPKLLLIKNAVVLCYNSSNMSYLLANNIIDIGIFEYNSKTWIPHISGLLTCYKYTFWQKVKLALGCKPVKINMRAKVHSKESDPFYMAILNRTIH